MCDVKGSAITLKQKQLFLLDFIVISFGGTIYVKDIIVISFGGTIYIKDSFVVNRSEEQSKLYR